VKKIWPSVTSEAFCFPNGRKHRISKIWGAPSLVPGSEEPCVDSRGQLTSHFFQFTYDAWTPLLGRVQLLHV